MKNTFPASLLMSVWYSGLCPVFFFFYLIGYWCEREAEASQKVLVISPWQHLQRWKDVCRHCQWEWVLERERQEQVWRCCCACLTLSLSPQPFPKCSSPTGVIPAPVRQVAAIIPSFSCGWESLSTKLKGLSKLCMAVYFKGESWV